MRDVPEGAGQARRGKLCMYLVVWLNIELDFLARESTDSVIC